MTLNQFLLILKARRWLIAGIFSLVVASALAATLLMPKTYTATAAVVLDVKSPDPIAGMILPGMTQPGYMATQLDLMRSERVVLGVIRALQLGDSPELRELWAKQTNSAPGSFEPWLVDALLKKFDARPSKESNVISISFSAQDPAYAAALANAVVESYIKTTLELRVEPAKQYRTLFDDQTKQARDRLEAAQLKVSEYQRTHGLIATDERLDIENARLSELSTQLVAIQAVKAESGSRQVQAAASPDRTQEALNNPVVASLNTEVSRLEGRLKELESSLGDAHPQVLQTRANIAELRGRISAEVNKVGASLSMNNRVNVDREAQIRAALEQQRQKMLALKAQRDEALVLIKDVESAQDAYNRVVARRDQTSIESQSTQTNVSIVKRATRPYAPSSPNLMVNLALAMAVGLVFALGTAVSLELWDRRLRADEDVPLVLGVPMLGVVLSAPRDGTAALPMGSYGALNKIGNAPKDLARIGHTAAQPADSAN